MYVSCVSDQILLTLCNSGLGICSRAVVSRLKFSLYSIRNCHQLAFLDFLHVYFSGSTWPDFLHLTLCKFEPILCSGAVVRERLLPLIYPTHLFPPLPLFHLLGLSPFFHYPAPPRAIVCIPFPSFLHKVSLSDPSCLLPLK